MIDEEIKQKAKDRLVILDKHIEMLQQTYGLVGLINIHAIRNQLHKRAVHSHTTLTGLDFLIDELEYGRSVCVEILGAKKIPIVIEKKLKLVVNNTGGK